MREVNNMLISTKGRYALRVLADIASYPQNQFVPLKEIAQRQEISEKYLETIVKTLVQEGVLEGLRGKGGGYRLSKAPDQFRVGDILRMMEGSLAPVACLGEDAKPCGRMSACRTYSLWKGLDEVISDYLDKVTIADLAETAEPGDDYVI
jgi:Rrf2 family protein